MRTKVWIISKISFLFLISLCLSISLNAQDNKKYWSDGKLTWQDFKENNINEGACELIYRLEYYYGKLKQNDTAVVRNIASCYVNPDLSWINPDFKNEQYLRYNQIIFDIVELYRRDLQYEIDYTKSKTETESKVQNINQKCLIEIEKFKKESNNGQLLEMITQWEKEIKNRLQSTKDIKLISFTKKDFGFGMHAGYGYGYSIGNFDSYFNAKEGMVGGFDFVYKNSILYFYLLSIGFDGVKQYNSSDGWFADERAGMDVLSLSYGFTIFDNRYFKFTPFAGITRNSLSGYNSTNASWNVSEVSYIVGFNADYKIRHKIKCVSYRCFPTSKIIEPVIRGRVYLSRLNFYDDLNGYIISVSLSFSRTDNRIVFEK